MTTLIPLPQFGFLRIEGRDAISFLQGYTTCDVESLDAGHSRIGAICNLQGRMLTSFRIVREKDGLLLRMSRDLVPATVEFLQKYIVFSKAEMHDVSQEVSCYGFIGNLAGFPAVKEEVSHQQDFIAVRVSAEERFEIWQTGSEISIEGAEPETENEWNRAEIEAGIAWVQSATAETFIPQMFDYHLTGGVDFDKGCYLGQEIVARMQYRGNLSRRLLQGTGNLQVGDRLHDESGRDIGTVIASAAGHLLAVVQNKTEDVPKVTEPGVTLAPITR